MILQATMNALLRTDGIWVQWPLLVSAVVATEICSELVGPVFSNDNVHTCGSRSLNANKSQSTG